VVVKTQGVSGCVGIMGMKWFESVSIFTCACTLGRLLTMMPVAGL
jgi:hypothetical protein